MFKWGHPECLIPGRVYRVDFVNHAGAPYMLVGEFKSIRVTPHGVEVGVLVKKKHAHSVVWVIGLMITAVRTED